MCKHDKDNASRQSRTRRRARDGHWEDEDSLQTDKAETTVALEESTRGGALTGNNRAVSTGTRSRNMWL